VDDFNARDLFAGLAMCGMLANTNNPTTKPDRAHAQAAYDIADAMLKEKEKRDDNAS
jgi:hypothetical protein